MEGKEPECVPAARQPSRAVNKEKAKRAQASIPWCISTKQNKLMKDSTCG